MDDQTIIDRVKSEYADAVKFDKTQMNDVFERFSQRRAEEYSLEENDANMQTAGWLHGNSIASNIKKKKLSGKKVKFHKDKAGVEKYLCDTFEQSGAIVDSTIENLTIGYLQAMNEAEKHLQSHMS